MLMYLRDDTLCAILNVNYVYLCYVSYGLF